MTKEEAIQKRKDLDKRKFQLEREFNKSIHDLNKEYRLLYSQCPHESLNGGSYTRWCQDCGESWDTT